MSVPPSGCFGLNFNEGSLPRPCSKIQTDRKSQRGWENVRQIANTLEKEKKKHLNKKGRNLLSSRPGPAGSRRDTSRQNVHAASPSQDHFPADPQPTGSHSGRYIGPLGRAHADASFSGMCVRDKAEMLSNEHLRESRVFLQSLPFGAKVHSHSSSKSAFISATPREINAAGKTEFEAVRRKPCVSFLRLKSFPDEA